MAAKGRDRMTSQLVIAHGGHWLGLLLPTGMLSFFAYLIKGGGGKLAKKRAAESQDQGASVG